MAGGVSGRAVRVGNSSGIAPCVGVCVKKSSVTMVGRLPMVYVEFRVGTGIPMGELVLGYNFVVTKKVFF